MGGLAVNIRTYYKATVIKVIWYWYKNIHTKKDSKKWRQFKESLGHQIYQHSHDRDARRREKVRNWIPMWKNNDGKLP